MLTAWKALAVLSTSVLVSVPVAVAVVASSVTAPVVWPMICAASFVPAIVTVTSCSVPSADFTVNVSLSASLFSLSALTVGLALFSV